MHPGPILTVDLSALRENYRILCQHFSGGECASVVKADAYGLGVEAVAKALHQEGCNTFFVATLDEGITLRSLLPNALIYVFHGPYAGEEKDYTQHRLRPVLNHPEQVKRWAEAPFALHIDTGMNRLGLTLSELEIHHSQLATRNPQLLLSHLACANEPTHPQNATQLERFRQACARLPDVPASLCNSSGIFLGQEFHFDLARPGCALYGITEGKKPMRPVVTLASPILQIRTADRDGTVGYGATHTVKKGSRTAIVQLGYADGYFRSLSNHGSASIGGQRVPIIGRISMDMIALDVSAIPEAALTQDCHAEFLNAEYKVDDLAREAGTIGYEVLTRLGARVKRVYS